MGEQTVTIRELRTDFRSVKRKIAQHGGVVITDRGEPDYLLQPLPRQVAAPGPMPDYMARLRRRQPQPLTAEQTHRLWQDERGHR